MWKYIRRTLYVTFDLLFFLALAGALWQLELLAYGMQQLSGQVRIIRGARPIDDVLKDAATPDSIKTNLELVKHIRAYAFDSVGLVRNENYTSFYDLKGQAPVYVVTACRPLKLEAHLWHFPVLGEVPYKGFFKRERARREVMRLRAAGWDAHLGTASGWSTLGWFKDPVLSNMLQYGEGDLAELLIHELTHGTLFVKDSVDFNENLASFVGYKGAIGFLAARYGENSPELQQYLRQRADDDVREEFMLRCSGRLDSLFAAQEKKQLANDVRLREKYAMYALFVREARALPLADTLFAERLERRLRRGGNAILMSFVRYGGKQDDFEKEFNEKFNGDLRKYVAWLREKWPSL